MDGLGLSSRERRDPLGTWCTAADDKVLKLLVDVVLRGTFDPAPAYMHWSLQLFIAR